MSTKPADRDVCPSVLQVEESKQVKPALIPDRQMRYFTKCFQRDLLRREEKADRLWKRLTSVTSCAPLFVSGHFGAHPVLRNCFEEEFVLGVFSTVDRSASMMGKVATEILAVPISLLLRANSCFLPTWTRK